MARIKQLVLRVGGRDRRRHYFDFEHVLDSLKSNLAGLGAHIVEHDFVVDAAQTGEEIKTAIAMFDAWRDYDPPARPSDNPHPCNDACKEDRPHCTRCARVVTSYGHLGTPCIADDAEWAKFVLDEEDRLYKAAFDYLRDHMRNWWD